MRVTVSRSGGFAGMTRRWQVSIDDLPDASDWIVLIRGLPWGDLPADNAQADRFTYRISMSDAEQLSPPNPEATLAEQQVLGPWRQLVDKVQEADSPLPRTDKSAEETEANAAADAASDVAGTDDRS